MTSFEPHVVLLAEQLSAYLRDDSIPLTAYHSSLSQRANRRLRDIGARFGRKNHRRLAMVLIALAGASTLLVTALLIVAWLRPSLAGVILSTALWTDTELTTHRPIWLVVRLMLQLLMRLLYLLALVQLWRRREEARPEA